MMNADSEAPPMRAAGRSGSRTSAGHQVAASTDRALVDFGAHWAFMVLLVWAPVPLGSNRPWALAWLASVLWLLVAMRAAWACTPAGAAQWLAWRRGWLCCALAAIPILVAAAQLAAHAQQTPASEPGALLVTPSAFDTRFFLLRALTCLAAVLLVLAGVNSPLRCRQVLLALLVGGLLQSMLAVLLYSSNSRYQFLFFGFEQGQRATGTFPNPDHLAGYLELSLAAGLGLLLSQFDGGQGRTRNWQQHLARAADFLMSTKMLVRMSLVVMVVALVITRSRMGNGAFFLSLLLVGAWVAAASPRLRRPALWVVASMAVVDLVVIGQWVGLARVVDRLSDTAQSTAFDAEQAQSSLLFDNSNGTEQVRREESLQQRLRVPTLSLPLVEQRPWFGHGGGAYRYAFPAVKQPDLLMFWDHAHNDYIELAVDVGLAGLLPLLLLAVTTAWRSARMLRDDMPGLTRGVGVAALTALVCMSLHSMVDFNLQIPANVFVFSTLLALVWAVPNKWPDDSDKPRSAGRRRHAMTPST